MRLPRILNQCHPIPGFVYGKASFAEDEQAVLIPVRPRKRSAAIIVLAVINPRPATTSLPCRGRANSPGRKPANSFAFPLDKVHDAVSYLVTRGLEHRVLGPIRAIGVDEIQRGKGHKYLTLVYQIDLGCTRPLVEWQGTDREDFQ